MKIVITVPGGVAGVPAVSRALRAIEDLAGGVTLCRAQGQWRDPNGHTIIEPVEQHHFCFTGPAAAHDWGLIDHHVHAVCLAMFEAGEQSVLVEKYGRSYHVNLYTAKDFT